ncbi:MAG TPA: DNA polymerase I [Syntrophales bacterium]|nr:DNA polymerase I [Syntrophales bacterium]
MTKEAEKPTLYLIDGSNYIYRAFYAIRELSNSKGFPTNAIYGFTNMLLKLLREKNPRHIAVVFDLKGPTFRHEAYEAYKATRRPTPDDLVMQIPYIKDVIRGFSIPVLEKEGLEADDIIGTIAKKFEVSGIKTVIVSGDKDMMQLISPDILMIDTMKDKSYDVEAVKERFGVGPDKVTEILGLTGDQSDNIPGVPGIGPKTAQRLIEEFGSVEGVLKNADKVRNPKTRESLRAYVDQARMSHDLAKIKTDADFDITLESTRYEGPDNEALQKLFKEFEFSSLLQELKVKGESRKEQYHLILKEEALTALFDRLQNVPEFGFAIVASSDIPMLAEIVGISVSTSPGEASYIPLGHDYMGMPEQLGTDRVLSRLAPFLSSDKVKKHGHDLKDALIIFARGGVELRGLGCDTMVSSYILNPAKHSFELADVVRDYMGRQIAYPKELVGSGAKALPFSAVPVERVKDYACRRADCIMGLAAILHEKIIQDGFKELYYEVEMPLISVLATMEKKGVLLDTKLLKTLSEEMEQLLSMTEENIYSLAGEKFNINSPKQLQAILFEKLGLPRGRKTKEGHSTDVEVLTNLAKSHELPAEIVSYRAMAKLKSTYIDALPALINPETSRIHTSYNQAVTATGRLSSSNPNLQNIPARTPEGKRIRQAFIAPEGFEIVSADYSQIELRILAHLSNDKVLIGAFMEDVDIHTATAANVFGVFPEMVTADMRRQAKVINFGILYGMSAFGLSKELSVPQKTAQSFIDEYFSKYSEVRTYLNRILECARRDGFVTTLLNRRRYLPEVNSSNVPVRQFAERMAINTPIQGTAADLIKVAMINISHLIAKKRLSASMIMQVHDELVFEVPLSEKEEVVHLVKKEMEEVINLKVPLKVDISVGRNWGEAHG